MDEGTIRQYALLQSLMTERDAINAEIEAMRQVNTYRLSRNESLAYTEIRFFELSSKLGDIANRMMQEV